MDDIVIQYRPFPKQEMFHNGPEKFRAFVGGIGSGKTKAGAAEAILNAVENPGSTWLLVAPTYPMIEDPMRVTLDELCPKEIVYPYEAGKRRQRFVNGSQFIFRSADVPNRLRGPNCSGGWGDEAAMWPGKAFDIFIGRFRLPPARGWLTTTPNGYDWIYRRFVESGSKIYGITNCDSRENPYLPEDFVSSLLETYSGQFAKQEVGGQFVAAEGLVYQEFGRLTHVVDSIPESRIKEVVVGVDWGFSNPTALIAVGFDNDDNAYVLEEFYKRKALLPQIIEAAQAMQKKWKAVQFYADPSEPQNIMSFVNAGIPCARARNEVIPGINRVNTMIARNVNGKKGLTVHSSCANLIREFENYRYPDDKEGHAERDVPVKASDHAMDALRYALYSHLDTKTVSFVLKGSV